ncbi:hypothetical protein B0H10DRAFT_1967407 [Mycena sp. CBHHK59/15]|nr:hypothetical protein B0H10DRAFT_1967407 [Mycena sp. CBHHK59/15]
MGMPPVNTEHPYTGFCPSPSIYEPQPYFTPTWHRPLFKPDFYSMRTRLSRDHLPTFWFTRTPRILDDRPIFLSTSSELHSVTPVHGALGNSHRISPVDSEVGNHGSEHPNIFFKHDESDIVPLKLAVHVCWHSRPWAVAFNQHLTCEFVSISTDGIHVPYSDLTFEGKTRFNHTFVPLDTAEDAKVFPGHWGLWDVKRRLPTPKWIHLKYSNSVL